MQHKHATLVDQLGGGTAIAKALWGELGETNYRREGVYKWKLNGVPWKYRQFVADLARKKRIVLPPNFLVPSHDRPGQSTSERPTSRAAIA